MANPLDCIAKLIAEATGKPWSGDNGIPPGADVLWAEEIEEFAQIMRDLAPLMLEVVKASDALLADPTGEIGYWANLEKAHDALDAYIAENLEAK